MIKKHIIFAIQGWELIHREGLYYPYCVKNVYSRDFLSCFLVAGRMNNWYFCVDVPEEFIQAVYMYLKLTQ